MVIWTRISITVRVYTKIILISYYKSTCVKYAENVISKLVRKIPFDQLLSQPGDGKFIKSLCLPKEHTHTNKKRATCYHNTETIKRKTSQFFQSCYRRRRRLLLTAWDSFTHSSFERTNHSAPEVAATVFKSQEIRDYGLTASSEPASSPEHSQYTSYAESWRQAAQDSRK